MCDTFGAAGGDRYPRPPSIAYVLFSFTNFMTSSFLWCCPWTQHPMKKKTFSISFMPMNDLGASLTVCLHYHGADHNNGVVTGCIPSNELLSLGAWNGHR